MNSLNQQLVELGLSTDEVAIYSLLINKGGLSAKALSEHSNIIVNSIYRSTKSLAEKGFIKELDVTPKQFQAVAPSIAVAQYIAKQISRLEEIQNSAAVQSITGNNPHRLNMDILTGRTELFDEFVLHASTAKQEILVISIGEPVPETIWSVTKDALSRGVDHKFIFHKYDKENIMLIKHWTAIGVPVRHISNEGYHLNIFDGRVAILSASNKKQSKERTGVVIYNEAIVEALRTYFYRQWSIARPV